MSAALACGLISAMAPAREAPATNEEKKAAALAYVQCQADQAETLDDGISDAATIGTVIANKCRTLMEEYARVMTKDQKRDRVRVMLIERMAGRAVASATEHVLYQRQQKKSAASN